MMMMMMLMMMMMAMVKIVSGDPNENGPGDNDTKDWLLC